MTRLLFITASLLGAATIAWVAASFIGGSSLALTVTGIIAAAYLLGLTELQQFRRATIGLGSTLLGLPDEKAGADKEDLAWLSRIDPSLYNSVRQRIDGDAIPLPGLIFTPYLASLLVMLGLLGTFIGMVDTLQGAVTALQGDTELEAIRNGLAAPIQGLGVAFGTSVAGIAASAMLGLGSTLCRRERLLVSRQLDRLCSTRFRQYSHRFRREQAYSAMQAQAEALPAISQRLALLVDNMQTMGQTLSDTLSDNQLKLHASVESSINGLAESVGKSLSTSVEQGGKNASESLQPLIAQTFEGIQAHAADAQAALADISQIQLEHFNKHLGESQEKMAAQISSNIARENQQLEQQQALLQQLGELTEGLNASSEEQRTALQSAAENLVVGSIEMNSLGEAFGVAVKIQSESNQSLMDTLSRVEEALGSASNRSDEQMTFYVDQAREVIDQTLLSQQGFMEELRQLAPEVVTAEAS